MADWKQLLYDNYVSTGQQGSNIHVGEGLQLSDFPHFSQIINRHVPDEKDIAIADLACGHGTLIFCLKELGYVNVEGVDNSSEQVALAHKLGVVEVKRQDIRSFLAEKEGAFDVIFLMDVIEHFERADVFELLYLVKDALTENGKVIIHVPNAAGIFGMMIRYGDLTHEICFTPQSIHQLLSACGFKNIVCYEDKPVVHGLKSFLRYVIWEVFTIPSRLLLLAEQGVPSHILSQNMLVTADRS